MVKHRLLAAALTACLLAHPAAAAEDVELLRALGLFQGSEQGDQLDQQMTRAEAAVMLVRLYGAADDMAAQTYQTPFTDLSGWYTPYVSWLYQRGLTHGTSPTTFSPDEPMTRQAYLLFLGRALGYSDNQTATGKSLVSAADYQASLGQPLTRGDAVTLTVAALFSTTAGGRPFSDVLIERGAVDAQAFAAVAGDRPTIPAVDAAALEGAEWQADLAKNGKLRVVCRQGGQVRARSAQTFDRVLTAAGVDGIFAYDQSTVYYLDPATLEAVRIADMSTLFPDGQTGYLDVLSSMNGTVLFCLSSNTGADDYRLYTWSPAESWNHVLTGTGPLGQVSTLPTVDGKYCSGAFGILSLHASGAQVLTRTPCYAMTVLGGILYFVPDDPVHRADGYSLGGHEVRMLSLGQERTVLSLPTDGAYPICLETVTGADPDGTVTARGTWHAADSGEEWHVMFSGWGTAVWVVDADNQHSVPDDPIGLYSAAQHMAWWADMLGLSTGPIAPA